MCNELTPWEKSVEFHGHTCPGLAIGYRAAMAAMEKFDKERAGDEEIVAIVETDACGVDAVQVITGCTMGKGNLFFEDVGKQAFTFAVRGRNEGLRCVLKYNVLQDMAPEEWVELRKKVFGQTATPEEKDKFQEMHRQISEKLLREPLENIMEVKTIAMEIPQKARIFDTIQCQFCGEGVMEPRVRVKNGRFACPHCI